MQRNEAVELLMVVFRIISTFGFASAEMLYFGAFSTLESAARLSAFRADQLNALAYSFLKVSGFGRVLGVGVAIMGISFTGRTFLLVLAPGYASPLLLFLAGIVFPAPTLWLLVKGVNVEQWRVTTQRT